MSITVEELVEKYSAVEIALDNIDKKTKELAEQQDALDTLQSQSKEEFQKEKTEIKKLAQESTKSIKKDAKALADDLGRLENRIGDIEQRVSELSEKISEALSQIANYSPSATGSSLKQALEANAQATYNEYEEDDDEFEFEPIESDDGKIKIRLSDDEKWMYLDFETAGASGPYRENMKANGWRYYAPDRVWSNFPNQENYDYAVGLIEEYNEE